MHRWGLEFEVIFFACINAMFLFYPGKNPMAETIDTFIKSTVAQVVRPRAKPDSV